MRDVLQQAEDQDAEAIVITEKDAVKIPREVAEATWKIKVYVICVEVTFTNGSDEFRDELQTELANRLRK